MAEINNAVALGVQTPKPQTTTDLVAPITSIAQLQYLSANSDRVKAETSGLEQAAAFNKGKVEALQNYNTLRGTGKFSEAEALDKSGLAGYDPAGAKAILDNVGTGRTLQANQNYAKANPNEPLAPGGPELVGKDVTNKATAATTAETNVKVTQQNLQLYGQAGNIMTAPGGATPQGRQIVADLARKAGMPEQTIQHYMKMPDDEYVLAGKHLQVASMSPESTWMSRGRKNSMRVSRPPLLRMIS